MFAAVTRALAATLIALIAVLAGVVPAHAATNNNYVKYPWSPNIYRLFLGTAGQLTLEQWQAQGSPTPQVVDWITGSQVIRYTTSPTELFLVEPGFSATRHHLTASEWIKTGNSYSIDSDHVFWGYTWNEHIVIAHLSGALEHATPQSWADFGSPTPEKQGTIWEDQFCQNPADGAIFWSNPAAGFPDKVHMTPLQYGQAGFPAFTVC